MEVTFEKETIELCARVSLFKLWRMYDTLKLHQKKCVGGQTCEMCEMVCGCESVIRFTLHIQASANDGVVSKKYWGREKYINHTWFREE
jgi:hypothetical protein